MNGASGKLRAITIAIPDLRSDKQDSMWEVFSRYYDDVDRSRFESDLSEKSDVILLYDTGDRSLQGFSTLQLIPGTFDGRPYLAIYSGDTIINEGYWGQTALQRSFTRYVLWQMVTHPTLPVYWFLISKGYKTYLLLSRNYVEHWPRWEEPTPPFQKGWSRCTARTAVLLLSSNSISGSSSLTLRPNTSNRPSNPPFPGVTPATILVP